MSDINVTIEDTGAINITLNDSGIIQVKMTNPSGLQWVGVPTSALAVGVINQIAHDTNYIYVCIATNTWKRIAIATWE